MRCARDWEHSSFEEEASWTSLWRRGENPLAETLYGPYPGREKRELILSKAEAQLRLYFYRHSQTAQALQIAMGDQLNVAKETPDNHRLIAIHRRLAYRAWRAMPSLKRKREYPIEEES